MRDGWRETTLGAITTKIVKSAPTQDFDYVDISSVSRDAKAITAPVRTRAGEAPGRARQHLRADDVLVSTVRPNLNAVARVPEELDGAVGSTGFAVLRASDEVHPEILFAVARSSKFVETMTERSTGSNYPAVTDKIIREFPIELPPLDEQRRIVDLIAAVDDAVDASEAESSAAAASAIDLRNVYFTDDAATMPLGEVAEVTAGKQLQSSSAVGEPTPYLRAGNIANGSLDLSVMKEMALTQPERAKLALRDGDVVVVEGGNGFGKSAIWRATIPGVVAYQNHVLRLRVVQDSYPTEYLSHWARWCHEQGRFRPTGSGIPNIGLGRARSMPIRVNESETLPDELSAAAAADAAADAAGTAADALRTLRSNLLTVLLSGEHEIPSSYDALLGEVA